MPLIQCAVGETWFWWQYWSEVLKPWRWWPRFVTASAPKVSITNERASLNAPRWLPPACVCVAVCDGKVTAQGGCERMSVTSAVHFEPSSSLQPHYTLLRPASPDLKGAFHHQIPQFSKQTPLACAGWASTFTLTDEMLIVVVVICSGDSAQAAPGHSKKGPSDFLWLAPHACRHTTV